MHRSQDPYFGKASDRQVNSRSRHTLNYLPIRSSLALKKLPGLVTSCMTPEVLVSMLRVGLQFAGVVNSILKSLPHHRQARS